MQHKNFKQENYGKVKVLADRIAAAARRVDEPLEAIALMRDTLRRLEGMNVAGQPMRQRDSDVKRAYAADAHKHTKRDEAILDDFDLAKLTSHTEYNVA